MRHRYILSLAVLIGLGSHPAVGKSVRAAPASAAPVFDRSDCSAIVDRESTSAEKGSSAAHFTTIQAAVDDAAPGDIICVTANDHHDERIIVSSSGTEELHIRIRSLGVVSTAGFVVEANYVVIEGFTISNRGRGDQDGRGWGIYLNGTGLKVLNNSVIDTEGGAGIGCELDPPGCIDAVIAHNTIRGAVGAGIAAVGGRILVERNSISGSVSTNRFDADGIRFFGSNITIRGNLVYDISAQGYAAGEEPHPDCFQTFDHSKPPTTDVLIEGNICDNVDHQCLMAEAPILRRSARITFQSNICRNNGSQALLVRDIPFVKITGNVFLPSISHFGVVLQSGATNATITNNVFVGAFRPIMVDQSSRQGLQTGRNVIHNPRRDRRTGRQSRAGSPSPARLAGG